MSRSRGGRAVPLVAAPGALRGPNRAGRLPEGSALPPWAASPAPRNAPSFAPPPPLRDAGRRRTGRRAPGTSKGGSSLGSNPGLRRAEFRGREARKKFGDRPAEKPMKGGGENLESSTLILNVRMHKSCIPESIWLTSERKRERQRHRQRKKQAPCREPNAGLDPGTPGSCPGPKAALNHWATRGARLLHLDVICRHLRNSIQHYS
ncbi:uncharacterized protein LOC125754232 [Canis lupus dingo]|uniref:uncharacterized protein LOC125754232 n=1 Tax=Canis lupus dingo TaxID=286419 RepID=UPI0020C4BD17|nr:uncharacterized protein LOC125754232 [Canis lupus dingo]